MTEQKVDLVKMLAEHFGCSPQAVSAWVWKGSITIDGHVIRHEWMRGQWTESQLYGRMLKCPRGERRLFGSRLVEDLEQLELGANG